MHKEPPSSNVVDSRIGPTSEPCELWARCLAILSESLDSRSVVTWLRPLRPQMIEGTLWLFAPNRFVREYIENQLLEDIQIALARCAGPELDALRITVDDEGPDQLTVCRSLPEEGDKARPFSGEPTQRTLLGERNSGTGSSNHSHRSGATESASPAHGTLASQAVARGFAPLARISGGQEPEFTAERSINPHFTFDNFIEGKSNQFARATSLQVAQNPGTSYNPLFIYGGVGLGKTHLMHAIGNAILERVPSGRVLYLASEKFVQDMVKALRHNAADAFKAHYRSATALLIDDIQFFANKERSQEEFFHTFNALIENSQQVILTSDRYPKDLEGLEERLKSRFSWGVTAQIEPPELETRVAILQRKAEGSGILLPDDVAFFMAKRIQSNIRELEGALRKVIANARFTRTEISVDMVRDALRDLLAAHDRAVSLENIQKTVAEFYNLKVADLHSHKRSQSITRPRQMAMALAKELTQHSLPEIGAAFGGRDHTTVIHAVKRVKALRSDDRKFDSDYQTLLRSLG
ncbi:MAG: chromosomal replication initiator protein DnaA [Thioalkalivibrionaceae bacterium]